MKKNYKFSSKYFYKLCEEADEMNESFKYEGSNDRAIVLLREKGYEINILRYTPKKESK